MPMHFWQPAVTSVVPAAALQEMGGAKYMVLSHRDDVRPGISCSAAADFQ